MSWQSDLLGAMLRLFAKPLLLSTRDPAKARRRFDLAARWLFRAPPLTLTTRAHVGVPGLWVENRAREPGVVLFFHGGAYVIGSARTHAPMLAQLAARTRVRVFAPDYRLVPEHPFPAAFKDALACFDALIARGYRPDEIVLGGDSAGGGLALALFGKLCRDGRAPAGLFAFSPWTDLTLTGTSLVTNARRDQLLPADRLTEVRALVLGGARPREASDPRLSPLYAAFPKATPVQIHVAESEILRDDSLRMRKRLPDADIRLAGDLPHVWPLLHGFLPEARTTLDETASFIRRLLSRS
ncbi:MAG: alpha/beta hydrolase [Paracoccaceae bacterium]